VGQHTLRDGEPPHLSTARPVAAPGEQAEDEGVEPAPFDFADLERLLAWWDATRRQTPPQNGA
jgi:hypothetical protein